MASSRLFTWKVISLSVQKSSFPCYKQASLYKLVYYHKYAAVQQNFNVENRPDSGSDTEYEEEKIKDISELKVKILEAAVNFVPEYGWSKKSLAHGAKSLGLSTAAHGLIESGGADLVHYFNFSSNRKLEQHLKENAAENERTDLKNFLENALEFRLRMVIPFVSNWPEAMALMLFPTQIPADTKNLLDMADQIWHYSGDKSLDMSWYSKRLSVAAAYKACELSLIQDKSSDFSDTFEFLERRVDTVTEALQLLDKVNDSSKDLTEFTAGALITARNLLGINRWFR
ncbi:ubiquinone biosynthesis protein COQ9, mitochondrial-like isoform X2 [Stegodyphus dumicola]|uniref:ubiquinone biosynthesis protein COQ9, mitochondrial-like isoform X2 n=1 Tax=Stegodyphus dumicola TaxID=202533 RepID=UPI0015B0CACA|nr:ubiquinone biosynthesis protein COQ9, mitochondrial-like isoform X2 [Stegodyphus dumicola]